MENNLIPAKANIVALFTEKGLDPILSKVKTKVDLFKASAANSVETASGRKEIASFAYKIAQSKTFIEKAGKELVSRQKAAIKLIDAERKRSRDFLDEQRDRARQPLTDYEEAEKKLIAEEAARMEFEADYIEALFEDDIFNRQREIERKENEFAKQEEERRRKEEADRIEKERVEREERIKKEAAEQAKKDAEKAITAEKERVIRLEVEAKAEATRVEQEKKDAIEKAEREKKEAVERAERESEAKAAKIEADRREKEAEEWARKETKRIAAERRAAHHKHRKKVEGEAIVCFTAALECTHDEAYEIVAIIRNNKIKNVTINY
jgi:hypothetical protein